MASFRYITIGFLEDPMVVLVWTPGEGACRIIGMRRANEQERRMLRLEVLTLTPRLTSRGRLAASKTGRLVR